MCPWRPTHSPPFPLVICASDPIALCVFLSCLDLNMNQVTLTSGIVPGMKFERDDKGSSVSFICKPVKDDGTVSDFVRLNIKVRRSRIMTLFKGADCVGL